MLCDVVLVAADVEIHAHKAVLAGCSPYFYDMFSKSEEIKRDRVVVKDVDSLVLKQFVKYAYTSGILITEKNVRVSK